MEGVNSGSSGGGVGKVIQFLPEAELDEPNRSVDWRRSSVVDCTRRYECSPHALGHRKHSVLVFDDSSVEPCTGVDLTRCHGSGAGLVFGALAQSRWHDSVLWLVAGAFLTCAMGDLSAPSFTHAFNGSATAFAWFVYSAVAGGSFRWNSPCLRMV